MTPSAPARHAVSTTASAAVLALAFGFFPTSPARAATAEPSVAPTSTCGILCLPVLAGSPDTAQPGRPRKTRDPAPPTSQPAPTAGVPVQPAPPQPPQGDAGPQDAAPPDPALPATPAGDVAPATASAAAGYRPPTGPSSGQDWNSPVTRSAAAAPMAAAVPARGQGSDGPEFLPIALGTLLVALSAGSFAWFTRYRNRLRSH
ncbi:hypothetical protein [Pseudarthrobacter enclensis]|uniref:Type IV secretory pathway VirB10-like protein n=1 Tax=Pseudarthrobacter enclensis TaxID=993070 RepID=A0ABT9RMW7_9MICC|nr:hypothetical protein [Pseudarthrobacter enclensis]MDP9886580.1 type IV secretory pathway VirB10-like protein [Pseudarthrobacter enclensis]